MSLSITKVKRLYPPAVRNGRTTMPSRRTNWSLRTRWSNQEYDLPSNAVVPEITTAITHLRDVLGDQAYESLARKGEAMTTAAIATYAYDQIDQARTTLEHPS
jgi:hypothetical protein